MSEMESENVLADAILREVQDGQTPEVSRASSSQSQDTTEASGSGLSTEGAGMHHNHSGQPAPQSNGSNMSQDTLACPPGERHDKACGAGGPDAGKQNGSAEGTQSGSARKKLQPSPDISRNASSPSPTGSLTLQGIMKGLGKSGKNLQGNQSPASAPTTPTNMPSPLALSGDYENSEGKGAEEGKGLFNRVKSMKRGLSFKRAVSGERSKVIKPDKSTQTEIDGNSVVGQSPVASFLHEICVATGFSYGEVWLRPLKKRTQRLSAHPQRKSTKHESALASNGLSNAMANGMNSLTAIPGLALKREDSSMQAVANKKSILGGHFPMFGRRDTENNWTIKSARVAPLRTADEEMEDGSLNGSNLTPQTGSKSVERQYHSTSTVPTPQQAATKSDLSSSIWANRTAMIADSPEVMSPKSVRSFEGKKGSESEDHHNDSTSEGANDIGGHYASLLSSLSEDEGRGRVTADRNEALRSGPIRIGGRGSPMRNGMGERVGSFMKRLSGEGNTLVPEALQSNEEEQQQEEVHMSYSHNLEWAGHYYGMPFQFQDGSDHRITMTAMVKSAEDKQYEKGDGFPGLTWARKDLDWHNLDMIAHDDDLCGDQRLVQAKKIFCVSVGIPIADPNSRVCKGVLMLYKCHDKDSKLDPDRFMADENLKKLLVEASDMIPTVLDLEHMMKNFRKLIQENAEEAENKKQETKEEETGLLTSFKAYLSKFRGADHTFPGGHGYRYASWACLGTMLALLLISGVDSVLRQNYNYKDEELFVLIGSYGAVAVMLFAAPTSLLVQPRNIIGGHVIAVVCAVSVDYLTSEKYYPIIPQWIANAVVPAIATWIMCVTGLIHPPAGACAVIYMRGGPEIKSLGWLYLAIPVLVDAVVLIMLAIAINNLSSKRKYPLYW